MRSIIDSTRLLVIAIDVANLIVALFYLAQQLTIEVIEVEVHITIAVAGQQDVTVADDSTGIGLLTDILVDLIFYCQLANGGQRIGHIDAQAVLMAVQTATCEESLVATRRET